MRAGLLLAVLALVGYSEELPPGRIIDDVKCSADPSQSYALYLPSHSCAPPEKPARYICFRSIAKRWLTSATIACTAATLVSQEPFLELFEPATM